MSDLFLNSMAVVSGSGSTLEAIYNATQKGEQLHDKVNIGLVVVTRPDALVIKRMKDAGYPSHNIMVISRAGLTAEGFGRALVLAAQSRKVNFCGLWGCIPLIPRSVIEHFGGMMVNQHPGPLNPQSPGYDFGGKGMYGARVTAARCCFVRKVRRDYWTEATAQQVDPEFDQGEVIWFSRVGILPDDTVPVLQARLLPVEHEVQIAALRAFATDTAHPIHWSPHRLVRPGEEGILETCKAEAIAAYPHG